MPGTHPDIGKPHLPNGTAVAAVEGVDHAVIAKGHGIVSPVPVDIDQQRSGRERIRGGMIPADRAGRALETVHGVDIVRDKDRIAVGHRLADNFGQALLPDQLTVSVVEQVQPSHPVTHQQVIPEKRRRANRGVRFAGQAGTPAHVPISRIQHLQPPVTGVRVSHQFRRGIQPAVRRGLRRGEHFPDRLRLGRVIGPDHAADGLGKHPATRRDQGSVVVGIRLRQPTLPTADPGKTIKLPTGTQHHIRHTVAVDILQRIPAAHPGLQGNPTYGFAVGPRETNDLLRAIIDDQVQDAVARHLGGMDPDSRVGSAPTLGRAVRVVTGGAGGIRHQFLRLVIAIEIEPEREGVAGRKHLPGLERDGRVGSRIPGSNRGRQQHQRLGRITSTGYQARRKLQWFAHVDLPTQRTIGRVDAVQLLIVAANQQGRFALVICPGQAAVDRSARGDVPQPAAVDTRHRVHPTRTGPDNYIRPVIAIQIA